MQESWYKVDAVNNSCGVKSLKNPKEVCVWRDFGMAQINYKTAKSYNFDLKKLLSDEKYSIEAGAKVLKWFKKTYSHNEKDWWTRYNCGTKPKTTRRTCKAYKKAVQEWL